MYYLLLYFCIQPLLIQADLWNKHFITYSVENDVYDPKIIKEAVKAWDIAPTLEFEPTEQGKGDIKIYFKPLSDSVGLSYPPKVGIIVINSNVSNTSIPQIIQHEFGHALGLKHSKNSKSIMRHTLVPNMRILKSDKRNLNKLYKCRYDSVTLLNDYTYLKFKGRYYERIDLNTNYTGNDTIWNFITKVTAMYRDDNYFIISDNKYFEFNHTMEFVREGSVEEKFPNISSSILAVLTLKNGTIICFLENKYIWYKNAAVEYHNLFKVFPKSVIQGAYSYFNFIYLVSRDDIYIYDEDFNFISKTRLCDDPQLSKVHCCNKYSKI